MSEARRAPGKFVGRSDHGTARIGRGTLVGAAGSLLTVTSLLLLSPLSAAALPPTLTKVAPYRGGVLPTSSLSVYGCNAKAKQVTPWHFSLHKGFGGGSDAVTAKACPQIPYRLGSQSTAAASGSEEVSILIKIPNGVRNVTANVKVAFTAAIKVASGSPTSACPTTPFGSTNGYYNNGTGWSYWPNEKGPIVYNNSTFYYYYTSSGASGSCASTAYLDAGVIGFMVASNGMAGYSMTPSYFQFGGSTALVNSTYWSCYNQTLWNYGTWSNTTRTCYSSNTTAYAYSYNYLTASYGTNTSMTFTGSVSVAMYSVNNFASTDRSWSLFIEPFGSLSASTYGFPHGVALGTLNLASGGNGITLTSITIT